jgi:hypothetical protein
MKHNVIPARRLWAESRLPGSGAKSDIEANSIQPGNNHEGSIPFTRSIDLRALAKQCSKLCPSFFTGASTPEKASTLRQSQSLNVDRSDIGIQLVDFVAVSA